MNQLSGPRLRITRANRHIADLESTCQSFICENPYRLLAKYDQSTGTTFVRAVLDRRLPMEVSVIIGDALHNLRSSLDHLVTEAVIANGHEPCRENAFPVSKNEAGFKQSVLTKLRGTSREFIDFVTSLKPYQEAGDGVIFPLSQLNNLDKHMAIIPVASVHTLHNVRVRSADGGIDVAIGSVPLSSNGTGEVKLVRIARPVEIHIEADAKTSFALVLHGTTILDGHPIIPTLQRFATRCLEIIDTAVLKK